ncbi:MAG: hypothetical protein IPP15_16595 [Saprospiraceae bacterium]|uniref:Uncharacterized protein n=1 Tax=Candidatus Opimibacter skivensis TaxID=2982028 RepID=A0A9D7T052_9BACT|nr:hypothetical protein [Candidatus Opimibacter skivensis]
MPIEEKNSVTISKNNSGFPAYLDFDKIRSEGIAYLGKLSGKLWTDHNVHDPGITILEELCYALLDLGYRTNLPIEDILARKSTDTSPDNNFFTPAQILTCNPLTILDYRKLLIDIPGVKNAWLEPATDIKDICHRRKETDNTYGDIILSDFTNNIVLPPKATVSCDEFLNGLYHVYIEPEKDLEPHSKEWNDLLTLIKKVLMAHRNLCEDFEDIYILCHSETGVCVSIDLEENADAENVYVAIANKLREFFSPAPKFYSLPELLEKGKAIEDIFAGRPFSAESHGFIDTEELEKIKLRKEIHTSDVYNSIFDVEGVNKISKLWLRSCGKNCIPSVNEKKSYWKFHIPENHVPLFSIGCSGFEFTKNGVPIVVDTAKFETLLELSFSHSGKVILPSSNLDIEIPKGIYHEDLENYYSIQNDFPRVYGIAEGGLPDDAPDKRKAWALQLKGYLLFFDQMLANYLSQLKNIRQLFQLKGPTDKKTQHTYFLNTLNSVPELKQLLRFGVDEHDNPLGERGTVLAYPISVKTWKDIDTKQLLAEKILQTQIPYSFGSFNELEEATCLFRDDLMNEEETIIKIYQTADDYRLFTISLPGEKWMLLGRKIACSEVEARQQALSVQSTSIFENNYRSFLTANGQYTFNIELNDTSYFDYLGMMVESDELYIQRRKQFLTHLLSRFSEKFTDFVLFNWKSGYENEGISGVERFLTHYDDLSRNRGRAYDYLVDGWNNSNSSGFEKKVKALAGIKDWEKNNLCYFAVDPYDEQYVLDFKTQDEESFLFSEKYDLYDDAINAASSLIKSMGDPSRLKLNFLNDSKTYRIHIQYGSNQTAIYPKSFPTSIEAEKLKKYLTTSFSQNPSEDVIVEHSWIWKINLYDFERNIVETAIETWNTAKEAEDATRKFVDKINDPKKLTSQKEKVSRELFYDKNDASVKRFIDISAFNIDINDTIIRKPGLFTYDVLDKSANSFKIRPLSEFKTPEQAKEHCCTILAAAADRNNFSINRDKDTKLFIIGLQINGENEAISATSYENKTEAEHALGHIYETINRYCYTLETNNSPESWKFNYQLGYDINNVFLFQSNESYKSIAETMKAAALFHKNIAGATLKELKNKLSLKNNSSRAFPQVTYLSPTIDTPLPITLINKELSYQQAIARMTSAPTDELKAYVKVDSVGEFGTYVYRLVDKDHVPAMYTLPFDDGIAAKEIRKKVAALTKQAIREIPEICFRGDIINKVTDKKGITSFHYQVKLFNLKGAPGNKLKMLSEWLLFESIRGYVSKDEAVKAFQEDYQRILFLASDKAEYGKSISFKQEKEKHLPPEAIVFIPESTFSLLQSDLGIESWSTQLADYLKTYPIKRIDSGSKEFAAFFCKDFTEKDKSCLENEIKWVYYFSVPVNIEYNSTVLHHDWRSTKQYQSPEEAMRDFLYFARLVKYTGNYFVDCACTKIYDKVKDAFTTSYGYKIFIREVLAESINWFETQEAAWGPEGIEKFICAVQSPDGFKNYLRKPDCCYSFYVTCDKGLLEHPCTYTTELQRDKAISELYLQLQNFLKNKYYGNEQTDTGILLYNLKGEPFAKVHLGNNVERDNCDRLIRIAEGIKESQNIISYRDGLLVDSIGNDEIIIQSVEQKITENKDEQEKWKQEWGKILLDWSCYQPITRTKIIEPTKNQLRNAAGNVSTTQYKYCIEIKLPGFNSCADDRIQNKPCGCNDQPPVTPPTCYIAWKGVCCYSSCKEAMAMLQKAYEQLLNINNYHPVFDCTCNSFGISLHTNIPLLVKSRATVETNSHIVAINPQCYHTQDEVCKAVETAKYLVNSEGMHLAEHILLRPHCEVDCHCREQIQYCTTDCDFPPYPVDDKDPCTLKPAKICFKPGSDPYSFMATIVLPAWSYRFRQQKNRQILENIIYREAPAHVLLRILWLKPIDLCRYETAFKLWRQYLAGKKRCNENFDPCKFLDLLFRQHYDCLDECIECQPCIDTSVENKTTCLEEEKKKLTDVELNKLISDQFKFLNQVNEVFCLNKYCDHDDQPRPVIDVTRVAEARKKEVEVSTKEVDPSAKELQSNATSQKESSFPKKPVVKRQPPLPSIKEPSQKITKQPEVAEVSITQKQQPAKQIKAKAVNGRQVKYRDTVTEILTTSNGNPLALKLKSFLSSGEPNADTLTKLTDEIILNEKPATKGVKKMTVKQQFLLLQAAVCYYVDKVCFNGKDITRINALQKMVAKMIKSGFDMQSIYNYWDAAEIEIYEPDTNFVQIKRIMTGKKK